MKELEKKEHKAFLSFKGLKLISPECAEELGIPAEGPVFVSPVIAYEEACLSCGGSFRPLVYQVGKIVLPHHYHEYHGGIYYTDWLGPLALYEMFNKGGMSCLSWMALIEPMGSTYVYSEQQLAFGCRLRGARAESVRVAQIVAHCMSRCPNSINLSIREGFIYECAAGNRQILLPVCSTDVHKYIYPGLVKFRFQISDIGEVHFSKI